MRCADELIAMPVESHVDAIPITDIDALAKREGCNVQSIKSVLRKRGYKAMTVYVKEGRV